MLRVLVVALFLSSVASRPSLAGPLSEIPFDITEHHTFIEVVLNGERLSFVFDTGAGGTAINEAVADRLGLKATGSFPATGVGGTTLVPVVSGLTVEMGDLRLEGITAGLVPLGHLEEALDRPLDGIIGREVMSGRVVVIDHERRMIDVFARDGFPFDEWGAPCRLVSGIGVARVNATVRLLNGDEVEGPFFVDTGAGLFLTFNTSFADRHELANRIGDTYARTGRALTGQPIEELVGRVAGVRLCGYEVLASAAPDNDGIPARVGLGTEGVQGLEGPAGIIGNEIFRRFNMAIDINGGTMYLAPNGQWERPIRTDASGLFIVRAEDGSVRIASVFTDSPAKRAGLLEGQIIRSIDGVAADEMTLPEIRERLMAACNTVRIGVDRDDASHVIDLPLRCLNRR